jgi:hypothetical protein
MQATRRDANGLDINVGRPLTPQETVDLSNAIGAWMLENNKGEDGMIRLP